MLWLTRVASSLAGRSLLVRPRPRATGAAFAGFAAFGAFWGWWGAALPTLRAQAGVSDARLGLALLFVSAGALPAMVTTGRLLDRYGLHLAALLLPCWAPPGW